MQKMGTELGVLSARTKETQATMTKFRNMTFVGAGITAVGIVIASGLIKATDEAGKLQTAMMSVKTAMKLTNAEYQKATKMSMTMGIPTIFSAQVVGGIMATASNAGLTKSSVLNPNIMKQYVNFADVQAQGTKKEDPNTAVAAAVKMTNLAGVSGVKNTSNFLNQLNAALMHTTDTATQFATNMKYYVGTAEQKGMSASSIVTANTWLSRMGLGGGRGGMATQQFLSRSVYGSTSATADTAMEQAGLVVNGHSVFESAKGVFVGFPQAMKALQDFNKREKGNGNVIGPLLTKIFGVSGMRVAQAMMQGTATSQYSNVSQQIASTAGVNSTQEAYNATWAGQTKQMLTTLQDIWTQFGFSAMKNTLPLVANLNKILGSILAFEQAHPTIMKYIATFAGIAAAVALIVGPLMLITGVIGYLSVANIFSTGLEMIGSAFSGLIGPLVALIAAGYLLYQAWTNDWGGIQEKTKAFTTWFAKEIPKAIKNVKDFAKDIGLINNKGSFEIPGWLKTLLTGLAAVLVTLKAIKLATLAWNLLSAANPWLAALALISIAVLLIVTNWDSVTKAIKNAIAAVRDFLGVTSGGQTPEQQVESAYTSFHSPNYKPVAAQLSSYKPTVLQSITSKMNDFANWVKGTGHNAMGTNNWRGGLTWVGERGPELVNLPHGSQVIPNNRIANASSENSSGGGITHTGDIIVNVYGAPGQSEDALANAVIKKLERKTYQKSLSHPAQVIPAW
jgi:TP901 family phage tail tape measure protein